jgi:hypothetical protein
LNEARKPVPSVTQWISDLNEVERRVRLARQLLDEREVAVKVLARLDHELADIGADPVIDAPHRRRDLKKIIEAHFDKQRATERLRYGRTTRAPRAV